MTNQNLKNAPEPLDKVTSNADEPQPTSQGNNGKAEDVIRKIGDEIRKMPELWLQHPTVRSLLSYLFDIHGVKRRFRHEGFNAVFESVLPSRARDYLYSADSIISVLAPNTAMSRFFNTIRNVTLLDSMVDDITAKINRTDELADISKISDLVKKAKDFPLRLKDYYVEASSECPLLDMALYALSQYAVGEVIELKSDGFRRTNTRVWLNEGRDEAYGDTLHCKLLYKTATMHMDKYGCYINSMDNTFVIAAYLTEYDLHIVMGCSTSGDRSDITIRRIYQSQIPVYVLYPTKEERSLATTCWCQSLPFSIIDFKKYMCLLHTNGVSLFERDKVRKKTENEIFDKKTTALVDRILRADAIGCSRAYALVGIPGTGKTFIMNKIISEATDAVIIEPSFPREGITCEFRNRLSASVHSISNKHIFIITDDFDKYMETDESSGKSTQELIYMFDYLRNECPGGVDEDGNLRKTFTLIATMNNPKQLANAVIKRSERFDEVIEIGLPQPYVYGKRLMFLKDADDATDFESFKYRIVYWYMRHKVITLADIGNIYSILKTHRGKPCRNCTYGVRDLLYAVKMIIKNRSTANKDYVL